MFASYSFFILVFATFAACNPVNTGKASIDCSGGCEYQIKVHQTWAQEPNGYDRTAEVFVPPTQTKLPVVIDLHGSGGHADYHRMGHILRPSIIVAAQGYENQWNIVKERTKAPDVDFMVELIARIGEIEQADMEDVTVIGTSNGAGLITRMLIEIPNPRPFKRVMPMVSHLVENEYHDNSFWTPSDQNNLGDNVYDQVIVPDSPGPEILYFHGTGDKTVPYDGGHSLGVTFLGAQRSTFLYAQAFGYNGEQLADQEGVEVSDGIFKYEYAADSRVVHYKMVDMPHNVFDPLYRAWMEAMLIETIEG